MAIHISTPMLEHPDNGLFRISSQVNDLPLWFDSQTRLQAFAESIVGLMLLPALEQDTPIISDAAVSNVWRQKALQLIEIFSGWWGYDPRHEYLPAAGLESASVAPATGVGLCFSGGVDSFYSLLHESDDVTHLVFAHGYDIPLSDPRRYAEFAAAFESIAAANGKVAVCIRTNLREHPVFAASAWEKTHGAALAALGHMLAQTIGTLRIPSTFADQASSIPWGSSPLTDPLWSTSDLSIVHGNTRLSRLEKTARIADDPDVQQYLRVCWQNQDAALNCSRCEKCLRTMVALEVFGKLSRFSCFEPGVNLARAVAEIRSARPGFLHDWSVCAELSSDPALSKAIHGLVLRSQPGFADKARHSLRRYLRALREKAGLR